MQNEVSIFRPVAIGTVAVNKGFMSKDIRVTPTEVLNYIDGELNSDQMSLDFAGVDEGGKAHEGSIDVDNTVRATWLPFGSNRISAPDVRRGERVLLYQIADADRYYWATLGLDDHLRALETVIFAINGSPEEYDGERELDPSNCYFFEISTHKKHVLFQTSRANGELCSYTVEFNPGTGRMKIGDDQNNFAELNSLTPSWHVENGMGTRLAMIRDSMYGFASQNIELTAGSRMVLKGGDSSIELVNGNITITSATVNFKRG